MLNLLNFDANAVRNKFERFRYLLVACLFTIAGFMPIVLQNNASAGTVANRSLTIGTSEGDATTRYGFSFDLATTGNVGSIEVTFCTTPLGSCTAPTGMDASSGAIDTATDDINGTDPVFSNGTQTANRLRITRTPSSFSSGNTVTIDFNNVDNPSLSGNTVSFYGRIVVFSDAAYTTAVDNGVVAAAVVRQLTVNGRVQERLDFCVAAIDDGGATDTTITALNDTTAVCADTDFPSTTTVDIGVIDDTGVYVSPVDTTATNGANDDYGIALVKTNAANGVAVTFFAEDIGSVSGGDTDHLKAFRVNGVDCQADQTTGLGLNDQCFRSASAVGEAISAGSERFGLKIGCIDANDGTRSTTAALSADADYADGATTSATDCENTVDNTNYAWNETTTAETLASSTGVVDDEIVKLQFAATSSSTTPTGSYTVVSTYIATPTF